MPLASEAIEAVESAQEGVLGDVFGALSADHPRCHAEDDRAMAVNDLLEGRHVAGAGAFD